MSDTANVIHITNHSTNGSIKSGNENEPWEYEDEEEESEEVEEDDVEAGVEITELEKDDDLGIGQEESEDATSPIIVENQEEILNATEEATENHAVEEDNLSTKMANTTNADCDQVESNDIINYKTEEVIEAETQSNSEPLEKISVLPRKSPAIPPFVTTPEPCNFFDDPATWIKWMEKEVNEYKEKKAEQENERIKKEEEEKRLMKEKEEQEALRKEQEEQETQRKVQQEKDRLKKERN